MNKSEEEIRLNQVVKLSALKLKALKESWDEELLLKIDSFLEFAKERVISQAQLLDLITQLKVRLEEVKKDENSKPPWN